MPSLERRLAPLAMAALTSPHTRALRRTLARTTRRLRMRPREVHYFHQVDDPYSALAAQRLRAFADRYAVELIPHLVSPPSDAAAPERALLEAFARRDAADIAPAHRLAFPVDADPPAHAQVRQAQRVLCRALQSPRFAEEAARVSAALWSEDASALDSLASALGAASDREAEREIADGSALRERLGHYLGAMFHYEGEWYWGIDRLHHLERRLHEEGALKERARDDAQIAPRPIARATRPAAAGGGERAPVVLDFFASLRSPYTYIASERVLALAKQTGAQLALRPVLPMVMRGLPVPRAKQLYIALDTKREAEDAGVPFGRVCDPVGRPVERAFSLYPFAREKGRAAELLLAFLRAAWAEGVDTGSDAGLRLVVERAGLAWSDAQRLVDRDESWRAELEANRAELFALGLWGVPSFRVRGGGAPDYATWGQDRLWRVEEEIRTRIPS